LLYKQRYKWNETEIVLFSVKVISLACINFSCVFLKLHTTVIAGVSRNCVYFISAAALLFMASMSWDLFFFQGGFRVKGYKNFGWREIRRPTSTTLEFANKLIRITAE
jgi:hypothetical protein